MDFSDYRQLNQPVPAAYPPYLSSRPAKSRWRWLWISGVALAILAALVLVLAVYSEIAARDAELKNFLKVVQQETSGAIIKDSLLGDLTGLAATSTSATSTTVVSDNNRRLAEKSGRPQLGNVSSSLVIVEFADFDCPVCLKEFPIIRAISNKYAKDILYIFRNYPVIDQNSLMLAQAGLCAHEQGKFWPFHDRLYANQGKITDLEAFKKIAIMSGLNWNKLQQCINTEKYKPQVLEDMQDALDLGAAGTPTFFINGKKLEGAVDEATWESIIAKYKELSH